MDFTVFKLRTILLVSSPKRELRKQHRLTKVKQSTVCSEGLSFSLGAQWTDLVEISRNAKQRKPHEGNMETSVRGRTFWINSGWISVPHVSNCGTTADLLFNGCFFLHKRAPPRFHQSAPNWIKIFKLSWGRPPIPPLPYLPLRRLCRRQKAICAFFNRLNFSANRQSNFLATTLV